MSALVQELSEFAELIRAGEIDDEERRAVSLAGSGDSSFGALGHPGALPFHVLIEIRDGQHVPVSADTDVVFAADVERMFDVRDEIF